MSRRVAVLAAAFSITASICLSFVHPWGNLRSLPQESELLGGSDIPQDVRQTLERKCADCHSNRTHWPVYSRLAPGSWLMEHDVRMGRSAINLSEWTAMPTEEKISALTRIAAEARSGEMPPRAYAVMHPANRLSNTEKLSIATWTKAERKRLRQLNQEQKGTENQ